MPKHYQDLNRVINYMREHWPSLVLEKWRVGIEEYNKIVKLAVKDLNQNVSYGKYFMRLAGLSGSGKTTQLLPTGEVYFQKKQLKPVIMAARKFVKYHPYYQQILEYYGKENIRKMTDEFVTIMLFLVMKELLRLGVDMILDVTLLDPEVEKILVEMLEENNYKKIMLMVVASPRTTEIFLKKRSWRHTKKTEQEFLRATEKALDFYGTRQPKMRVVMWSVYNKKPVFDGEVKDVMSIYQKYVFKMGRLKYSEDELVEAKIKYLC